MTEERTGGGTVVLRLDGQLVVTNREMLRQRVEEALARGDRRFVLDFAGTGYIDTAGLSLLLALHQRVTDEGGAITLAGLNEELQVLVELAKLHLIFRVAATADAALSPA